MTATKVPPWARRVAFGVGFWLAVAIMAFPAISAGAIPVSGTTATHAASHATASVSHVAKLAKSTASTGTQGGLAGTKPGGEQPFAAATGIQQLQHQTQFAPLDQALAGGSTLKVPAAPVAATAAPHPSYYIATGAFTGYIYDRETNKPIIAASVEAFGANGQDCPPTTCAPVASTANGSFTVYGPVGFDYVQASADWYLGNLTYATAGNGTRINVGTIYLVESAIGVGIVKADVPKTYSPIPGVQVTDATIDSSTLLSPPGSTLNNGSFRVAIADSPSILTFTPPYGLYLGNFTWANGTPGQVVHLGTIYLERMAEVKVNVTDAVTGGRLNPGSQGSLQVCSLANGCGQSLQGNLVGASTNGPTVFTAAAVPGASYAILEVTGYAYANIIIGDVPPYAGHVWWMHPVNITPDGGVHTSVGMSGNDYYSKLTAPPHTGLWTISSCTFDGYSFNSVTPTANTSTSTCATAGCQSIGTSINLIAAPLRNEITIEPDYSGLCGNGVPTWPIPGYTAFGNTPDIPVWENQTWVNVTPDLLSPVDSGWMNFTAGTYIHGNVTVQGTTRAPHDFSVAISPTNYPTLTPLYGWDILTSPWATWACGTMPSSGTGFCAPAPPGPDLVTISSNGYPSNFTWVSTPEVYTGTPAGVSVAQPENLMLGNINLTAGGFIAGNITQAGTNFGLPLASYEICSVSPTYPVGCAAGSANLKGQLDVGAPLGWDYVKVSASGYQPDFVWAYVPASQVTVYIGNVGLQPLAQLAGRVVDPYGNAVLGATAVVCSLTTNLGAACPNLGAGRVSSNGVYLGDVIGGWLPEATYRVVVTAAGYSTNWAWVNATAGQQTNISQLTLYPSGSNGSGALPLPGSPHPAATISQVSTWLVGRLMDNVTQLGVQTTNYQACPAAGGPCVQPIGGSNTGGFFNLTVPAGLYYLNVTASGYLSDSVYFNSSGAAFLDMGAVDLTPLPWVFGNVTINPWNVIYVPLSSTVTDSFQMGPVALVNVCSPTFGCAPTTGPTSDISPTGQFMVWGEPGIGDTITVAPSVAGIGTSANGGYNPNATRGTINVGQVTFSVPGTIKLDIFAAVSFTVWNNVTYVGAPPGAVSTPIKYASVGIAAIGNHTGTAGWSTNGSGGVTFFVPSGNPARRVTYTALVPGAWEQQTAVLPVALTPGESYMADSLAMFHFGWETGLAVTTNTYQAAAYLPVHSTSTPIGSTLVYTASSVTNGGGFFNATAAADVSVRFDVGPGNDYNNTTFYAPVNFSATSAYKSTTLTPKNLTIDHWGYVGSTQVNYSAFPTFATVIDPVKNLPLPNVNLVVSTTGDLQATTTSLSTSNVGGEFFVDAPPGYDWANFSRAVYEPNTSRVHVHPGEVTTIPTVNMTGDGVIAARIVSEPGNVPVVGANITDCLGGQRLCGFAQTNGTGVFWVNATPGLNFLNVTANGFISPGPTLANVCSDCYVGLTDIPVYQPAYISGIVLGLPAGFPVYGANVSACSPIGGSPTGPCLYSVQSTRSGSFLLVVPAGAYVIAVAATNYNSTYLQIHVRAGQHVSVGSVFLESYGSLSGAVYDNATTIPIRGAQVYACPVWSGGTCVGTSTDVGGHYAVNGAPGAYVVTISASGYADFLLNVVIVGGRTTLAPTAFMDKLGIDTFYSVSGTVLANGVGLANAVVSAQVGGVSAATASTSSSGAFSLSVLYGTYNLVVTAAGEAPLTVPIVVHGTVTGLKLTLSVQTYEISGRVTDGLTGNSLSGVEILDGSQVLATTGSDGQFSIHLSNGTTQLTAIYAGALPVGYADVNVSVSVNGASGTRDITMYPPVTNVFGEVVDAASGAPLPNAGVIVTGTASDGKKVDQTFQASASGRFQIALPEGTYTVTGIYGGYTNASISVVPKGATATQVVVPLSSMPTTTSHASPSATMEWLGIGTVLVVIAAVAAAAVVLGLSRRRAAGGKPPASGGSP